MVTIMKCVIKSTESGHYYTGDAPFKFLGSTIREFGKRGKAIIFPTKKEAEKVAKQINNVVIEKA